ncbi:hypothetical protein [Thermodesulfovibrio hydrogeniphilus]
MFVNITKGYIIPGKSLEKPLLDRLIPFEKHPFSLKKNNGAKRNDFVHKKYYYQPQTTLKINSPANTKSTFLAKIG